jgi:hypothetical protein
VLHDDAHASLGKPGQRLHCVAGRHLCADRDLAPSQVLDPFERVPDDLVTRELSRVGAQQDVLRARRSVRGMDHVDQAQAEPGAAGPIDGPVERATTLLVTEGDEELRA